MEATHHTIPGIESGPRPLADILKDLARPIPARHLREKKQGGAVLTFCPWYRTQKILDHYTRGHWESRVTGITTSDERVFVTVRVTIHAAEGSFSREATGTERLSVNAYGDPSSNAESMAFRRACAKFGLGLHLYEKED
ncbi:hypothetical protein GQ464_002270 [Rhodocaloribacter litoris]|uniref:DUF1071 domain-containing protein n=1 Tax=Rhodocaloribacter litoris TaxID=2558931 RepID=UPI00142388C9|nr:DUF1071 domain-containing protein [Rhodocaloribacter litoris]QXD15795.1 hypothetical protein GQ464_002270 [Rhodocaloribacter litoris]